MRTAQPGRHASTHVCVCVCGRSHTRGARTTRAHVRMQACPNSITEHGCEHDSAPAAAWCQRRATRGGTCLAAQQHLRAQQPPPCTSPPLPRMPAPASQASTPSHTSMGHTGQASPYVAVPHSQTRLRSRGRVGGRPLLLSCLPWFLAPVSHRTGRCAVLNAQAALVVVPSPCLSPPMGVGGAG